ncbi:hypothetical protein M1446_04955 [Candidatus Dependentiae bacterium]|nr:hypothetical protein [Candidatus Dependentiae bacterium]
MFKKILTFAFSISTLNCAVSPIEQSIINSDYDAFVNLYNNPKLTFVQNKAELKKIAEKILNERIKFSKDKKYSTKDIARMGIGLAVAYFFYNQYCKYENASKAVRLFKNQLLRLYPFQLADCLSYQLVLLNLGYVSRSMLFDEADIKASIKHNSATNFFKSKANTLLFASGIGYSLYTSYDGFKHKDNSDKLRNAHAIKQILNEN